MDCELPLVAIAVVVEHKFEMPALAFGCSIVWFDNNIVDLLGGYKSDDKSCGGLLISVNFVFCERLAVDDRILMNRWIGCGSGEVVDYVIDYCRCQLTMSYTSADFGVGPNGL